MENNETVPILYIDYPVILTLIGTEYNRLNYKYLFY